ncbi:MAG: hypothetical protein QOF96_3861 [Actinomycetota bacterium]|nr:hypothetical protein [Actinomycetota bacterium]
MERGSDKHSPMVDEALKHDTASIWHGGPNESRSEEFREQEGPAEGEPTPDARIRGGGEIPGTGLSLDDLNGRAELARYLEHRQFPARPDELAAHARERHAPDAVLALLERAPDKVYETVSEVWVALGGRAEPPRDHND